MIKPLEVVHSLRRKYQKMFLKSFWKLTFFSPYFIPPTPIFSGKVKTVLPAPARLAICPREVHLPARVPALPQATSTCSPTPSSIDVNPCRSPPPFSHSLGGSGFWVLLWVSSQPCLPLGGCRYPGNPPMRYLLHRRLLLGKFCSRNRQCCAGHGLLVVRRGQILCSASECWVACAQNGWILLEMLCKISCRYKVWLQNAAVLCKKKRRTFVVYAVLFTISPRAL